MDSHLDREHEQGQPYDRRIVVCISGKRKSGKDFICRQLAKHLQMLKLKVVIRAISAPLKDEYATIFHLDSELLKTDAPYKEAYRRQMVAWGEDIRRKDPSYFCRAAIAGIDDRSADIILISDIRRPSDIEFFKSSFGDNLRLIRVKSSDEVRTSRGWKYTANIDDAETECALDDFNEWHFIIDNNEFYTDNINMRSDNDNNSANAGNNDGDNIVDESITLDTRIEQICEEIKRELISN